MSTITESARAAYQPVKERKTEHTQRLLEERKIRAEGHFARAFGEPLEATTEDGFVYFTIDKRTRLAYVGNQRDKRPFFGPGWAFVEKCGGCKRPQFAEFVRDLADLGRVLTDGTREWVCPHCNIP